MIYRYCTITQHYPNEFSWQHTEYEDDHGSGNSIADCQVEIDEYWDQRRADKLAAGFDAALDRSKNFNQGER